MFRIALVGTLGYVLALVFPPAIDPYYDHIEHGYRQYWLNVPGAVLLSVCLGALEYLGILLSPLKARYWRAVAPHAMLALPFVFAFPPETIHGHVLVASAGTCVALLILGLIWHFQGGRDLDRTPMSTVWLWYLGAAALVLVGTGVLIFFTVQYLENHYPSLIREYVRDVQTPRLLMFRNPMMVIWGTIAGAIVAQLILAAMDELQKRNVARQAAGWRSDDGFDAFLSYSHTAISQVQALASFLSDYWVPFSSVSVFRDQEVLPALGLRDGIGKAIRRSRYFVLCWSKGAEESNWIAEELGLFLDEVDSSGERVVLCLVGLKHDALPPLPERLTHLHERNPFLIVDLRTAEDSPRVLRDVIRARAVPVVAAVLGGVSMRQIARLRRQVITFAACCVVGAVLLLLAFLLA